MTRLASLPYCLALALLAGSFVSQVSADTQSFDLFLRNMSFRDMTGLESNTSQVHKDLVNTVKINLASAGGESETILISDGGGCVRISISWRNGDQAVLGTIRNRLARDGFMLWDQTWAVSFIGCADGPSVLSFKFWAVNLTWSESFRNHSSAQYQGLFQDVKNAFAGLGGSFRALEVAENYSCVEFYIQSDVENAQMIMDLVSVMKRQGLMLMGETIPIQMQACRDPKTEPTNLKFRFYIANMNWSESFKNHSSDMYQDLLQEVKYALSDMDGTIRALEVADKIGCIEIYVEMDTMSSSNIINVMSVLLTNGIMINNQFLKVLSSPCSERASVLKLTFYVANLPWSEDFKDHNSSDFLQMKQTVQEIFNSLGGTIRALEIAENYGCVRIYLEWYALYVINILDTYSVLKQNGFTYMSESYEVQNKPCEAPLADINECPILSDNTFGICIDGCNANDAERNCSVGFKCCSNGCGRTCQRVGYRVSMSSTILIDLGWMASMISKESPIFSELKAVVKNMVMSRFNVESPSMIADVELQAISNYNVQGKSMSLLNTVIYLVKDISNEELEQGAARLMNTSYSLTNGSFRVTDVRLDSNFSSPVSMCGGVECYGVCKQLRNSIEYCSCSAGYVGTDCSEFDCRNDTYTSLCENGGECAMKARGTGFECKCMDGFAGPLCQVSLDSCPVVAARKPDLIGRCRSTCVTGNCSYGEMCCQVACGGDACVEVGYFQKMLTTVTIDFPFIEELNDPNSFSATMMKPMVEDWITSFMRNNNVRGFKSVRIVDAWSSIDVQGGRRKRENGNTVLQLECKFNNAIPVEDTMRVRDKLLAGDFGPDSSAFAVLNITFGSGGVCPSMACAPPSFCVTNFGGEVQCACPETRTGRLCDVPTCRTNGVDRCQNGGMCSISNVDMQMRCDCPAFFKGELCEELADVCALGLCINGGICHNLPGGKHHCECPEGFSGTACETAENHCPSGRPLMTTSDIQQCRRQACPKGFMCNVDPLDKWTACCFKKDFLCDQNPCQAGGVCVSDFNSMSICQCPNGTTGLFCEQASNGTAGPTACQKKQLFSDWIINLLGKETFSLGISLQEMRVILEHQGYQYFPTDMCDAQGNFKSVAKGVLVVNPSMGQTMICLDESGYVDPECRAAICDILSNNGSLQYCLNGGKCLGEITQQLCDCSGTGYHGIRCELSGVGVNETSCTIRRDISNLAIGILNGTANLMPGLNKETVANATKQILKIYNSDNIFVPYCDNNGQYGYRGCVYEIDNLFKKNCYCALEDGEIVSGSEENPLQPPENCRIDQNPCPPQSGDDCKQPDWWCSDKLQCQPDSQRCAYFTGCDKAVCLQEVEAGCVDKSSFLACDPHPCKDDPFNMCQPCGLHGTCYNVGSKNTSGDSGYTCECKTGYSGDECEVDENLCSGLPSDLCVSRCIGDVSRGQLCQCDPGYGGIFCNMPARGLCKRRKTIFDDAIKILKRLMVPWYGHSYTEMQSMATFIVQEEGAGQIPVLNCTDNGFYEKVQCMVSTSNWTNKWCHCVDNNGERISSNIKPYIGYDVCTAPTDSQELVNTACNAASYMDADNLTICQNGGICIFEMYGGKFCSCPDGYYGQFCQHIGSGPESKSLCNFFADLWQVANEVSTGRADWITSDLQKYLYLNISLNFLQLQDNQSLALKLECNNDGTAKQAACYYNIMTGEKHSCYCWSFNGMIMKDMQVESADTYDCIGIKDSTCPKMKCRYICEHGYRKDNTGCQTCDCKDPCEHMECDYGQRCVIENLANCDKDAMQLTCTRAVCRPFNKPGACPGYSAALFEKALAGVVTNYSSCSVKCYDDTDCEGKKKCCGLCNKCIDPEVTNSCMDYQNKMKDQLAFISLARVYLMTNRFHFDLYALIRVTNISLIWIPTCASSGAFEPLQCQLNIDIYGVVGNVSSCFCVDFLGNKIEGAIANQSDPLSCDVKPFTCPFVEPAQSLNTTQECKRDFECALGQKCCSEKSGRKVCQNPVDTSKLMTTLDTIMSNVCEESPTMCQGGSSCVENWMERGVACECPYNRVGPYCEQLVSNAVKVPRTTCERKALTLAVFVEQLRAANSTLPFMGLMTSVFDDDDDENGMQSDIVTAVWYKCKADGAFEPKQCVVNAYDGNGDSPIDCFCVYENGTEILGTRTPVQSGKSLFCGGDSRTCPSGNAARDNSGWLTECSINSDCSQGYSCSRSTYGRLLCCPTAGDTVPCPGDSTKVCSESVCKMAIKQNCSKNPCAVCKVSPCTCQPYFVDVSTGNNITENDCKYLSVGLCKSKKCAILKESLKTSNSNSMPDCDETGMFRPKQCQGQACQCVDQLGVATPTNPDGTCKNIDKIRTIKFTFTFQANYTEFRENKKLQALVEMLTEKLKELGINPKLIKEPSEPYEGSIKIDVTIENGADTSNIDLAQILQLLKEKSSTGALDLTINGQPVRQTNLTEDIRTESQAPGGGSSDGGGLTRTEKIIIGVVCGGVGLLILALLAYCLCCRQKKQKGETSMDDSFETDKGNKVSTEPSQFPVYNHNFEDDNIVKVRL